MFRRLFWFLSGAAAGVWATVKVGRTVRRLQPDSLALTAADRALETGARLKLFARDVRAGMAQREGELHDALGLRGADDHDPYDPQPLPAPRTAPRALPGDAADGGPAAPPARSAHRARADRTHQNRKDEH